MNDDFTGVDTEEEWGAYRTGRRIEIERGGWSPIALSGWGPGSESLEDTKFYLVQRDRESPHPLRWHSKAYATVQDARDDGVRLRVAEATDEWPDRPLCIPYVSQLAFDHHHSPYGCKSAGSVGECLNGHKCIITALDTLRSVVSDAALLKELLGD